MTCDWVEVSAFYIRGDDEALDAIGYTVRGREDTASPQHKTGGQFIAGAYPGSLQGLCDRLNQAREKALAGR